jgi:uncharacterized protein
MADPGVVLSILFYDWDGAGTRAAASADRGKPLMDSMHPEQEYFAHLAAGRFMLQRSASTGGYVFYPRVAEPGTGATDLEWVEASGRGVVYAATTVRQRPPTADYGVALIELDEGPRLISRVDGLPPADVEIGMRVRARIVHDSEGPLLVFVPVEP